MMDTSKEANQGTKEFKTLLNNTLSIAALHGAAFIMLNICGKGRPDSELRCMLLVLSIATLLFSLFALLLYLPGMTCSAGRSIANKSLLARRAKVYLYTLRLVFLQIGFGTLGLVQFWHLLTARHGGT